MGPDIGPACTKGQELRAEVIGRKALGSTQVTSQPLTGSDTWLLPYPHPRAEIGWSHL